MANRASAGKIFILICRARVYGCSLCDGWGSESGVLYGLSRGIFFDFKHPTTDKTILSECQSNLGTYHTWAGAMAYQSRNHFKLPFEIADEKDEIETYFETLLRDPVEDNAEYAMEIWEWCIDTFLPYIQYANINPIHYDTITSCQSSLISRELSNHSLRQKRNEHLSRLHPRVHLL